LKDSLVIAIIIQIMTQALVLFHSQQYGNTEKMAEAVAKGLREGGCSVTLHNTNEKRYPIEEYAGYDLLALGTPDYFSYMAGTLKTFLDDWYLYRNKPGYKEKPYVLFLSHGGGGRAEKTLSIFRYLGTQVGNTISSQGSPNKEILKKCKELGALLAEKT
jgi:NAD(P)H dehydrogenase (quinone)